jgi:hypothetical protein
MQSVVPRVISRGPASGDNQVAAGGAGEHQVILTDPVPSLTEPGERCGDAPATGTDLTLPDFGVVRTPTE